MNDILKTTNTTFKTKNIADKFKADMDEKWLDEFKTIWETKKVHERLTLLNAKKQQLKQDNSTDKAW